MLRLLAAIPVSEPVVRMGEWVRRIHGTYREGVLPPEWHFGGLHVITQDLLEGFFKDDLIRLIGRTGLLDRLLQRFGRLVTIHRSTSLSLLKKNKNPLAFPPLQALAVSLNENRIE